MNRWSRTKRYLVLSSAVALWLKMRRSLFGLIMRQLLLM